MAISADTRIKGNKVLKRVQFRLVGGKKMEKSQTIQEVLKILREDQCCFDKTVVKIKIQAAEFLKRSDSALNN